MSYRVNTRRLWMLVAVALVSAAFLGACGGDDTAGAPASGAATSQEAPESGEITAPGVDVDHFFEGALVGEVTTTACTLSGGSEASCYDITVAGYPADTEVGPFCPRTTDDTAEEVGIWFDGEALYDIDGQFVLDLPDIYQDDNWRLHDDEGNVNVTDTQEAFEAAARPDVDPEYQNHCVEGSIDWLEGGEPIPTSVEIPTMPIPAETSTPVGNVLGVTLNGVVIAGEAPVDAILGAYTIAAFDDCGGHINPFDGYHLHGATGCSETGDATADETPAFAYALDGYAIHSPLSEDHAATIELDECNGHTTDGNGYHYHASRAEENAVLICFTGETSTVENGGAPEGGGRPGPGG